MPEPADAGLPHPFNYDTTSIPGVVIDNVTGLWWQQLVPLQTFDVDAGTYYCAALGLADAGDWRLPTEIELVSLVDFTVPGSPGVGTINSAAFPSFPDAGTTYATFWSNTPMPYNPYNYQISFKLGDLQENTVTEPGSVRCVRGNQ